MEDEEGSQVDWRIVKPLQAGGHVPVVNQQVALWVREFFPGHGLEFKWRKILPFVESGQWGIEFFWVLDGHGHFSFAVQV